MNSSAKPLRGESLRFHFFKVYGIGLMWEPVHWECDDNLLTHWRVLSGKLVLGFVLINFHFRVSRVKDYLP